MNARRLPGLRSVAWVGFLLALGASNPSRGWTVDEDLSTFAVLTHKAGVGARLAHDHVIHATGFVASLELDPVVPESARFSFEVPVDHLAVDEPARQQALAPFFEALGLVDAPFEALRDKSRRKIRAAMLGSEQLDAARHPTLSAEVVSIEAVASKRGREEFSHRIDLALTIRGQTVRVPVSGRMALDDATGMLTVDAVGDARFTDFGIEPYRALLGAVRNDDVFQVVVRLHARP